MGAFSHRIKPMQNFNDSDPQSVQDLLNNQTLRSIINKAQQLNALNHLLPELLPNNLSKHCQVMNLHHLQLIIMVNSATALTELRFLEPELLKAIRQRPGLQLIRAIKFKLRPN